MAARYPPAPAGAARRPAGSAPVEALLFSYPIALPGEPAGGGDG